MVRRTVSDCMAPAPTVVDHGATLRSAAQTMAQQGLGALLVAADGEIVGVVTDHDLVVRGLAAGLDGDAHVRDVISGRLATLAPGDLVADALQVVRDAGLRRAPVLDGGVVVGMVSIRDLAVALDADAALSDVAGPSDD